MSSVNSVNSSQSSAVSQYQDYLARLRATKAATEGQQDSAKQAQIEKTDLQADSDHDGD